MPKPKTKTFEESLSRLEKIMNEMESGSSLENSIKLFKEGAALTVALNNALNDYEQEVTELIKTLDGEFVEKPFMPLP